MKKKTVMIVDRDKSVRHWIREYTKSQSYHFVFWECSNGLEAVKYINDLEPDLLFLDVNLAGICGFKVIETITHRPFVIFTSSCGKDAAKAFEYKALDYIIKPIAFNRIQLALERYDQWMGAKRNDNSHNNVVIRYSRSILVEKGERLISISLNRITYLKAEKDYTWIYTVDGERYLSSNGIGQLEPRLDPDYFIRIHRSYIVNADYIRSLYRDVGKHIVSMPNNLEINVGRNYLPLIKKLIF